MRKRVLTKPVEAVKKIQQVLKNRNGYRIENIIKRKVNYIANHYSINHTTGIEFEVPSYEFTSNEVYDFIIDIRNYVNEFVEKYATEREIDPNSSILDLLEDDKDLDATFDMVDFEKHLYESNINIYKKMHGFPFLRRIIFNTALYEIIRDGGKIVGPERALLFAKVVMPDMADKYPGCDPGIPVSYVSYDTNDENDERFIRFLRLYKKLGSGSEPSYWFPHYFEDSKFWDCSEEFDSKINRLPIETQEVIRNVYGKPY